MFEQLGLHKSDIWIWTKQLPGFLFCFVFFVFDKTLNSVNEVWSVATHLALVEKQEQRAHTSQKPGALWAIFPFVPVMFILALDDVTAVFPPRYSSSNIASLTAQLKMHEDYFFICARVRTACSGFSSDHQGPVSIAGPLGSQRSHHTTPRGNKVRLWVCRRERVCVCGRRGCFVSRLTYATAFVSMQSTRVCAFASFVEAQKWQHFSGPADRRRPLQRSPSVARPRRPLTAHLSLFT